MSFVEVQPARAKEIIRNTNGFIAIGEEVRDHNVARAVVRDLVGLGVDDSPIRFVPIGQAGQAGLFLRMDGNIPRFLVLD